MQCSVNTHIPLMSNKEGEIGIISDKREVQQKEIQWKPKGDEAE